MESNSEPVDSTLEQKRQAKLNKLSHHAVTRISEAASKRAQRNELIVESEQNEFFVNNFYSEVEKIQELLKCENVDKSKELLTEHFNKIAENYERLRKFLNDSTIYLKSFELNKAQNALKEIQSNMNARKDEMLPRKKFAFKSKKTGGIAKTSTVKSEPKKSEVDLSLSDCDIRSKSDEKITLEGEKINQKDIALANLNNCQVMLKGYPGTVHITHADNCVILCGPVSGSVFVDKCTNTKLITGCQQLRVHNTNAVDFYLHVTSRAIIEDSSNTRFAPYNWKYDGIENDFDKSGLDRETNNYDHVDDFNWLALDTVSPNWKVLPENERISNWS